MILMIFQWLLSWLLQKWKKVVTNLKSEKIAILNRMLQLIVMKVSTLTHAQNPPVNSTFFSEVCSVDHTYLQHLLLIANWQTM